MEYALGGNAVNSNEVSVAPRLTIDADTAYFVHLQWTNSNSGIGYVAEWTDNLISGLWTNGWEFISTGSSTHPGYTEIEYEVAAVQPNLFFRLKVTQP